MIHEDTFKKETNFQGAKGLVFVGEKIIIFRRDTNTNNYPLMLDLPGGGREEGESPFDTFKRETMEEFGLEINEQDITFSREAESVLFPDRKSFFLVARPKDIKEEKITFGDEGLEWMLMTPEDFISREDGVKGQQERVASYINYLKESKETL